MSNDLAYAAGFMDADGCISLYANKGAYRPSIEIAQVTKAILVIIQGILNAGGRIYTRPRSNKCRDAYVLSYFPKETRTVIERLAPYLKVKHKQAKLLASYFEVVDNAEHRDGAKKPKLRKIKAEFTRLNKRGR